MDDIFLACVADMIAYLECGIDIKSTSILHTQLVECSKGIVPEEYILNTTNEIKDEI